MGGGTCVSCHMFVPVFHTEYDNLYFFEACASSVEWKGVRIFSSSFFNFFFAFSAIDSDQILG